MSFAICVTLALLHTKPPKKAKQTQSALFALKVLFYTAVGAVGGAAVFLLGMMVVFNEIRPAVRQLLGKAPFGTPVVVPASTGYIAVTLGAIFGAAWVIWPKWKG